MKAVRLTKDYTTRRGIELKEGTILHEDEFGDVYKMIFVCQVGSDVYNNFIRRRDSETNSN